VCQERLNRKLRMTLGWLQEQPLIDFTLIIAKYCKRSILLPIPYQHVNRVG